ncbi:transglutaminase domain-containing protein [Lysinibacillus telephonicus]|uniref:transglutaminase domain-containing protein n=1 Tax=Lysinibacillus telephonicus TaxID=1714840 RepID=UPI0037D56F84
MLKRIIFLVIVIVLLKPTYDFGSKLVSDVNVLLNENNINIQDATSEVLSNVSSTAKDTIVQTASTITAVDAKLPSSVETTEELAEAFYYHFSRWETDFEIRYNGSTTNIETIIETAVEEAANRDQYILGHLADRKIEFEYNQFGANIKVHQSYLTNAAQEEVVNEKVAAILATVDPASLTDFERVKFVNDYIVKNTEYSEETSASPHSAFAIVQENRGVCQGYALLALKMLQAFGVETKYVVGEVYTGGHAWNLVKVDGEWYHLDTTWNDPTPDRKNIVSYGYFLMNDEKMELDHSWIQSDYPSADSNKYAFMAQVDHAYEVDGMIYYSNVDDNNRLYRLDLNTGENTRLTDSRAQYIVGYSDWLYFSNYSHGGYLSKIKKDGTEESIIYKKEVNNLFVEDGSVYFNTDSGLKKIEL